MMLQTLLGARNHADNVRLRPSERPSAHLTQGNTGINATYCHIHRVSNSPTRPPFKVQTN